MAGEYWGNTVYSYQNGKKRSVETTWGMRGEGWRRMMEEVN
jgi:hypothetical protein